MSAGQKSLAILFGGYHERAPHQLVIGRCGGVRLRRDRATCKVKFVVPPYPLPSVENHFGAQWSWQVSPSELVSVLSNVVGFIGNVAALFVAIYAANEMRKRK